MTRVRLSDIARAAGVSPGTVSHVFNHPERVRPALRERVREAAERLGYRGPDPAARALRAGRVGSVGVVSSNDLGYFFEDPFARRFMEGVAGECDARGAGLSLISTRGGARAAWTIDSALVDGFIVLCAHSGDRLAERAQNRGLPLVLVDRPGDGRGHGVVVDDEGGAAGAAWHLLGLGHRRLGVLAFSDPDGPSGAGGPDTAPARFCGAGPARLAGYRRAVGEAAAAAHAGAPAPSLTVEPAGEGPASVGRALRRLLAGPEPVTAVLAMSDLIALHALTAAERLGVPVPGRLSVVGFDDLPEAAAARPALTPVRQPVRDKGRAAARALFEGGGPATLALPVELVVRASSAPVPGPGGSG